MSKSRWLFFLIMGAVVLASILVIRSTKDLYKVLPANLPASISSTSFEDWRQFVSDHKKFKVLMPNMPHHATESLNDPKTQDKRIYDIYVSEKSNGTIFMISLITYPEDKETSDPAKLLKSIVDEMIASNPNNKLLSSRELSYLNNKAVDFSVENADVHMDSRAFVKGNTLYVLSYIAKIGDYNPSEYEHFIDSFNLIPAS